MKKHFGRKLLAFLLVLMCVLTSIPFSAGAEEGVKVEIVSFMRGAQKDLRSSELLEARVTGYDGNVQELTYEWTNTLGTYLYVYNSHNMYYINNTDGEIEIYNSKIAASTNMAGRSYKDTFSGQGYCWAAVYGSNTSGAGTSIDDRNAYNGVITVKVKDKDGNIIATDTHEGKVTTSGYWWNPTYKYSGIVDHKLQADMDDVTIGIFEGDTRNVKDLLGESAILHITCVESTVNKGTIVSGKDVISLHQDGDYYITAGELQGEGSNTAEGDAKVELTIQKNTCKFHEKTTATATTTVYVFKKPTTATTAYTLTLTGEIDHRCTYYINGQTGVRETDENGNTTIVFTGLNPNTNYEVEVRGHYKDENGNDRIAYAYVYDTTKPVYTGTVEVYLNGEYDSSTHMVTSGTKVNLEDVSGYATLYAKEENGNEFIKLENESLGTYASILDSGSYKLYYTNSDSTKIDDQLLTMHHADRTRYLFYNSVTYINEGETFAEEFYVTGTSVNTIKEAPQKEGYVFMGWKDEEGNLYSCDSLLTNEISTPYVLEAVWVKGIDVTVNVVLEHEAKNNGGIDLDQTSKFEVSFDLMQRLQGSTSDYTDVLAPVVVNETNYNSAKTKNEDNYVVTTAYIAKAPNLVNVAPGMDYSVEIAKSGYELRKTVIDSDAEGNVTITAYVQYDPKNADLEFDVKLDDASKELIKRHPEYKPQAVNVKVLSWYSKAHNEFESGGWHHITQHHDTFVTVYLDENGEGKGTYPVWKHNSKKTETYYYRIKVVSYVLEDGTVIETENADDENLLNVQYITADERYLATITVSDEGIAPPNQSETTLTGAYFTTDDNDSKQRGSLLAEINIETFDVTFKPEGGTFSDGTTEDKIAASQIVMPDLSLYTPTREGGYVFDGWHEMKDGVLVESAAQTGDYLFNDVTLYAKWKEPLTVEGTVYVAGYYYLNENIEEDRIIEESARTHAVTVYLQKLLPNNYTETIKSMKVDVEYDNTLAKPMGTASYTFTEVPDDGHSYRVLLQNPNYIVSYQNEPDSLDESKINSFREAYYQDKGFTAEFGETQPLVANVNAFMRFAPHEFNLRYQVIATTISEAFRPDSAEILVLSDDGASGINPQSWPVISKMVEDGVVTGESAPVGDDGISEVMSYPVWMVKPDGHTLYDYSLRLKDYIINGTETEFIPASAPFYATYNGSARYSALENLNPEHQTQLLTVTLQPKRYTVTFLPDFTETEEDHISSFKYKVAQGNYRTSHIWSYDTDLSDAVPVREGYKFLGWYDDKGNLVTEIDAAVAEDVTLTAKWTNLFTVTFHANNEDVAEDIFRVYYEEGNTPEGVNTLKDGKVESFYDLPQLSYTDNNKYVFKGWYLDKDNSNNSNPINWNDTYTEETHIYAHWIEVSEVAKDTKDTKVLAYANDMYPEYDLAGVQIRDIKDDSSNHFGQSSTGLRFITVMSERVYDEINSIMYKDGKTPNSAGAEYGFVIARTDTTQQVAEYFGIAQEDYRLEYRDKNVNGVDTTSDYRYVQNMVCSGYDDHRTYDDYRLYTAVVTYDDLEGDALVEAQNTALTARAYIRYYDSNGLYRTYYNNYTGTFSFGGCSASFSAVSAGMGA